MALLTNRLGERLGLLVLLLVVLVLAVAIVISGVSRSQRPDVALLVRPADAYASARWAELFLQRSVDDARFRVAEDVAQHALTRDPTAARAVYALAESASSRRDESAALRKLQLAGEMTRRHLPTNLSLIQAYLRRGEYDEAFTRIDMAVSSSRDATAILFPAMAAAIADDQFIPPVAASLARDPWWAPSLLSTIAQSADDLPNATALFVRLAELGRPPRSDISAQFAKRLEDAGRQDLLAKIQPLLGRNSAEQIKSAREPL